MVTKKLELKEIELIQMGWKALVDRLGLADATRFVTVIERSGDDSVKELNEIWDKYSVDEIHRLILEAKARGQL